jgi:hypothetical protein
LTVFLSTFCDPVTEEITLLVVVVNTRLLVDLIILFGPTEGLTSLDVHHAYPLLSVEVHFLPVTVLLEQLSGRPALLNNETLGVFRTDLELEVDFVSIIVQAAVAMLVEVGIDGDEREGLGAGSVLLVFRGTLRFRFALLSLLHGYAAFRRSAIVAVVVSGSDSWQSFSPWPSFSPWLL